MADENTTTANGGTTATTDTTANAATTTETAGTGTSAQTTTEGKDTPSETTTTQTRERETPDNQGRDERTFSQAELNAIVKKAEKKAADAAKAALEQQQKDAELSEAQKEKKRADEAEQREKETQGKLRRYTILDAARDEAERQKLAFNPGALSDAYDLRAFEDVEIGEDGAPSGIGEALKALAKAKPYLLKPATTTPHAPDLDAQRGGGGNLLDTPEAQASRRNLTKGF